MKPLYIFDLDGTLALLTTQRRAIIVNKEDKQRWRKFYEACTTDLPNRPVIQTLLRLRLSADIKIWSGRSDEVRVQTISWLKQHIPIMILEIEERLQMRCEGDYTPDNELKANWLAKLNPTDRARLVGVFDDRDKVVAMWRANNICCFQVAPGEF